jgi:hypothetical protein
MKITQIIIDEECVCQVCKDDELCKGNFIFLNLFPKFSITAELCDEHLRILKEYIKKSHGKRIKFKTKYGTVSFLQPRGKSIDELVDDFHVRRR